WTLHLQVGATVCPGGALSAAGDNVTISIVDTAKNTLLFHVTLPGTTPNIPPLFTNYGVVQPGSGGTNQNYTIYTSIRSSDLDDNSVYVNLASIPGAPATPVQMHLCQGSYACTRGQGVWTFTELGGATTPVCCQPYLFEISARDNGTGVPSPQHNSVAFSYTFPSAANTAALLISLMLSVGNPTVGQNVVLTADVGDNGGAPATGVTVSFSSSVTGPIPGTTTFSSVAPGTPVPNPTYDASTNWKAGPHAGAVTIKATAVATSGQTVSTTLAVTVFPRTLLIDESGVAPGLNASLDTFTYLETDMNSADIPYNATTVVPGSSVIGWGCGAPTCLNNYDVVIWLLSNNGALTPSDMTAINCATSTPCLGMGPGQRSVWIVGGDALQGAAAVYPTFGISGAALTPFSSTTYPQILPVGTALPTTGILGSNLYLNGWLGGWYTPSLAQYYAITTAGGGVPVFQTLAGSKTVACAFNGTWRALAMPFELSTVSMTMPWGGTTYQTSLGQQASIVYDAFNWLANFTSLNPHRNGNDWAVSEVDVQPSTLTFNTPAYVNFTVRDNGPTSVPVQAELLVDNLPLFVGGSAVTTMVTPSPEGGTARATFNWTPSFIGYLTVGVEILPPSSDLSAQNNLMENSLFAEQLYVHYNVLLVDATLNTGVHHDTTGYVYNALIADGYPSSTITTVTLTNANGCGSLPGAIMLSLTNSPPRFNLVVWNLADTTNGTGCPLNHANLNALTTFLDNGGTSSSLLFIGNGLLTDVADGPVINFAGTFLGIKISSAAALTPTGTIYGASGDQVGNGVAVPYPSGLAAGNTTFTALNNTPNELHGFSFYFNDVDYWTFPNTLHGAGASAYSIAAGWHTAYWAFNLATVNGQPGGTAALDLSLLRFSTFAGRLLPQPNAIVDAPDITFATAQQPWTNFDKMHPQLDQQYLIRANVTNLGGTTAFSVGAQVFDGSHILGSSSVTVGPSFPITGGLNFISSATISVAWTPLYGYTNPIKVVITSGFTAGILPGVAQQAQWNVTVFFFYDPTTDNSNQWTHDDMIQWDEDGSGSPPVGQQIFISDDSNQAVGSLTTAGPGPNSWGQDTADCYMTVWSCTSSEIQDDQSNSNGGSVSWLYSAPIQLMAGETSAQVNWWQSYDLSPFQNGGILCVLTSMNCPTDNSVVDLNAANGIVSPGPGYSGTITFGQSGACEVVSAFTGANTGFGSAGPANWQFETVNLTRYIPASGTATVYVGFGFVEGTTSCGGSASPQELGWWIDQPTVLESGGPTTTVSNSAGCPSPGSNIPVDLWRVTPSVAPSFGAAAPPTGGAWLSGAVSGTNYALNPNMWDSLYSRPIDLSSAANATLSFNYVWSRNNANGDPPMGLIVQATPVLPNGETNWVQIWTANIVNGVTTGNADHNWHFAKVDLSGYLGSVIKLRFVLGTNCGLDGDDPGTYAYPYVGAAAMVSGVYVQGATSITAIRPGAALAAAEGSPAVSSGLNNGARSLFPASSGGSETLPGTAVRTLAHGTAPWIEPVGTAGTSSSSTGPSGPMPSDRAPLLAPSPRSSWVRPWS
ncbi:MAG: hypothetical protein KGI98_17010, partial [Euryarchaeota archaeon]|nr:hypothetical protein [Euryarchaeota archaeon]MDE1882149.1 hypothetical protein [Euryarchaeota archaeon]